LFSIAAARLRAGDAGKRFKPTQQYRHSGLPQEESPIVAIEDQPQSQDWGTPLQKPQRGGVTGFTKSWFLVGWY